MDVQTSPMSLPHLNLDKEFLILRLPFVIKPSSYLHHPITLANGTCLQQRLLQKKHAVRSHWEVLDSQVQRNPYA